MKTNGNAGDMRDVIMRETERKNTKGSVNNSKGDTKTKEFGRAHDQNYSSLISIYSSVQLKCTATKCERNHSGI